MLNKLRQDNAGSRNSEAPRNIALILVESYGISRDANDAALVSAPFNSLDIRQHYDVTTGTVPFHGSTVSAEFRELCGMSASIGVHPNDFSSCLPTLLKQWGYETISFHGFTESMFARNKWYPIMGFDKSLFAEQMEKIPGVNICGGIFPGVCDADVARLIGDYLANNSSRRNFVYWVTLNSHLPVLRSLASGGAFNCGTARAPVQDADICMWMSLIYKAHSSIAALALRPDLPATEFYIVGDHAPPFILQERRKMFSPGIVPYLHLVPR
ncbi:MAG: sulfatase-like hydrolase/transferase [Candidatus Acidiferrales bacterium]